MAARGSPSLKTYLDQECNRLLDGEEADLGETLLDGDPDTTILYIRNEGDRTWRITKAEHTERSDINFHWDKDLLKPGETMKITLTWDTANPVDDLKYAFRFEGKYYPFSDE